MTQARKMQDTIHHQIDINYESANAFKNVFNEILAAVASKPNNNWHVLKAKLLDTPLGSMIAVADEKSLYLLAFVNRDTFTCDIERLHTKTKSAIIAGESSAIKSIDKELKNYFSGQLKSFNTPMQMIGTSFQQKAWQALQAIPYGITKSYKDQATAIGKPRSFRAVANANGANQFAVIVPCHRIINSNGDLGGYGAGLDRKQWLLDMENKYK